MLGLIEACQAQKLMFSQNHMSARIPEFRTQINKDSKKSSKQERCSSSINDPIPKLYNEDFTAVSRDNSLTLD